MNIDISVVVPTHNRRAELKNCLDSLFNQDYPQERIEIIVIDDSASEVTEKELYELKKSHSNLRYFAQYHKGPASGRNLGARASLGEVIGFIDDDCVVSRDWIKLMIENHRKNPQLVAVGGLTLTSTQNTSVLVSQFLSTCSIEISLNGRREVVFFPTCNVSLKRWVFEKYKFNEKFPFPGGEDLEFFWRLFKDGYRFIWNKDIRVMHYRDDSTIGFIGQAYVYGRGNFLVQHLHKDQPLLKELKTGRFSFWSASIINIIKIPRFSYLLGKRLIREGNIKNLYKKLSVYSYFVIHKIFYILGNILEFIRIKREDMYVLQQPSYNLPRLFILDITHHCNLSCRICDIWKTGDIEKDIDIPYVKKMLSQAKDFNIPEIALSGGEPLHREDIFEILEYSRRVKIKNLGVLTNGMLVAEYIEKLKPYLIDNTISLVSSLDSLKPETHNYLRNSDLAWQKAIESLKLLSLLKKEYPQINFNVITIILNQNLEELLDIAIFIKDLDANSLQFQTLLSNNLNMAERKKSLFWVSEERLSLLDEAIDKLIGFKKENPQFIKNSIENLSLMKKYYRGTITSNDVKCLSAYETILISNQGECTTCFSSYGDIKRQNLETILESREKIKAQEKVKNCPWPCLLPCFCDS